MTEAGVWHGYLENVVFSAELVRMREMVEAGGIGRPISFRAREAHSGPHAAHFWDVATAGGGALLDMASHGIEAARYLFGKESPIRDAFAWGDTLVHGERTTAEDNAVMLMRFEDGRVATMDVSWSSKGGLEGRFELTGTGGRMVSDMSTTVLRAFIEQPAGYLGEKADAETGWVFPVPDETYTHGHDAMMGHMVEAFRSGTPPRETFHDGLAVNRVLDAAYRSMRSGHWEPVGRRRRSRRPPDVHGHQPRHPADLDRARPRAAQAPRRHPGRGPRDGKWLVRRCHRGRRPGAPVRHRTLAHPRGGDVPALRVLSRGSTPWSSCR